MQRFIRMAGLRAGWTETAFRQEAIAAIVLLPLALWLGQSWVERALLAGSVLLVLIVELLNSGIEAAIDRVGLQWHALSKRAKDLGSAAVLLSLLLCARHLGRRPVAKDIAVNLRPHRPHRPAPRVFGLRLLRLAAGRRRRSMQHWPRATGRWIGAHGGQLVYGGGRNGLMGIVADATLAGRRTGGRRHSRKAW